MNSQYRNCEFCGTRVYKNKEKCPKCNKGLSGNYKNDEENYNTPDPSRLTDIIIENVSFTDGIFNSKRFDDELKINKFDIDKWNSSSYFKTGVRYNIFFQIGMYIFIIFLIFGFELDGFAGNKGIIFLILTILGSVAMIPINKVTFKKSINFNDKNLIYEKPSRYSSERYEIEFKDLERVEIIFDSSLQPTNIIFTANKNANVSAMVFNLPIEEYYKKMDIVQYLMLFSLKNSLNLFITQRFSEVVENLNENRNDDEILFVRIDSKIGDKILNDSEFENHINYLKKVAENGYFMGGRFENSDGGMIVFYARNIEEAHKISKNDPVILNGFFEYELKEWKVVLKS